MNYFWLNSIDLGEGSTVNPGTWFRLKETLPLDNWYALEDVYEKIRVAEYGQLPSRKKSIFLFLDKQKAIEYQSAHRQSDLLYEVSVNDGTAPCATLDMAIVDPGQYVSAHQFTEQARRYWQSSKLDGHRLSEFVAESSITILKKINI